jgi:hypothetical protein
VKIRGTVRFREKAVQDWLLKKEQERKSGTLSYEKGKEEKKETKETPL